MSIPSVSLESHFTCGKGVEQSVNVEQTTDFISRVEAILIQQEHCHFKILTEGIHLNLLTWSLGEDKIVLSHKTPGFFGQELVKNCLASIIIIIINSRSSCSSSSVNEKYFLEENSCCN